jgi:hypothetical protein
MVERDEHIQALQDDRQHNNRRRMM